MALYAIRVLLAHSTRYSFIPENLALAWTAPLAGWLLARRLKTARWRSWQAVFLTLVWLLLLPNTWYVLTDFIHVYSTGEVSLLFDIVLMGTLVISGFLLGFASLFMVQSEIKKRMGGPRAYQLAELVILISSFAIYLGRVLRWNSWDVLANPGGLIVNVSDRVAEPFAHPSAINTTGLLFIFLSVCYFAFWRLANALKNGH